ncbi:MAG: carbonic anhydrase [bacterium]
MPTSDHAAPGHTKAHWGYSGEAGPSHWGSLDGAYTTCGTGKNQSPINLSGFIEADMMPIQFDYGTKAHEILNNGHTVQANYQPGSSITVDGHSFELKQFHFHAPSENTINGESFPMEAHLVHADKDGNLAVVAVMFREGEANHALESLWSSMPEKAGTTTALPAAVSVNGILPTNRDYYRFNGSLTTPPCSEGVEWLVLKTPVTASAAQIEHFSHTMHHPNNRPVQPVNARPVLQ